MGKQFGQTAADYEEDRANSNDDDVWIRSFRDASTKLRIIPMRGHNRHGAEVVGTAAWPTEREHFEQTVKAFPCDESSTCPGCTDSDPKVKKRDRKYYFPALDEKGVVRIFKMGPKLYRVLQGREQRLGTLSDRDYFINKMGSGLETTYDPEPGEKYEIDFSGLDVPPIAPILEGKYKQALEHYAGGGTDKDPDAQEPAATPAASGGRIQPGGGGEQASSGRIQPGAAAAPAEEPAREPSWSESPPPSAPKEATPPSEVPDWGPNPTEDQIGDAETGEIRAWLTSRNVEFPARAPRARILAIAKEEAAKPPY